MSMRLLSAPPWRASNTHPNAGEANFVAAGQGFPLPKTGKPPCTRLPLAVLASTRRVTNGLLRRDARYGERRNSGPIGLAGQLRASAQIRPQTLCGLSLYRPARRRPVNVARLQRPAVNEEMAPAHYDRGGLVSATPRAYVPRQRTHGFTLGAALATSP